MRGRFFLIVGVITIVLALYGTLEATSKFSQLNEYFIINFFIWLGIGITEISVGWLVEEKNKH